MAELTGKMPCMSLRWRPGEKQLLRVAGADGGGGDLGVGFDINVGDGRFISLSDPSTINHLEDDMKDAAVSQLKILQDQMASLMAQLGN